MKTFRWIKEEDKTIHEYRFDDNNICIGFFSDGKEITGKGYKGKPLTESWSKGLQIAGFNQIT